MNSKYLDREIGLLKIKVLAYYIIKKQLVGTVSDVEHDFDDDKMLNRPVA